MSRRHIDSLHDFLTRPCDDTRRYLGRRIGDGWATFSYSLTRVSGCKRRGWCLRLLSLFTSPPLIPHTSPWGPIPGAVQDLDRDTAKELGVRGNIKLPACLISSCWTSACRKRMALKCLRK